MNKKTANKVLAHFEAMFTSGNEVLYLINNSCPDEVRRRYQEVLGRVVSEIDLELLEPKAVVRFLGDDLQRVPHAEAQGVRELLAKPGVVGPERERVPELRGGRLVDEFQRFARLIVVILQDP